MTRLQEFLVRKMKESGLTQRELAVRAGLTEKHVSQMMTGRAQGSFEAWTALLNAAGVVLP